MKHTKSSIYLSKVATRPSGKGDGHAALGQFYRDDELSLELINFDIGLTSSLESGIQYHDFYRPQADLPVKQV